MALLPILCQFHQTVVMITHNDDIARLAGRLLRIEDGRLTGQGGEQP